MKLKMKIDMKMKMKMKMKMEMEMKINTKKMKMKMDLTLKEGDDEVVCEDERHVAAAVADSRAGPVFYPRRVFDFSPISRSRLRARNPGQKKATDFL